MREPANQHLRGVAEATAPYRDGASTKDYPGYDKMAEHLAKESLDTQISNGVALVGTAKDAIDMVEAYARSVGGLECASLQIMPSTMDVEIAERAMRNFSAEVMPRLAAL
jgi:hypothetical protein